MDFFESQEAARRRTRRLVVLFLLAVTGIVAAVYLAVLAIFFFGDLAVDPEGRLWDPVLFAAVAAATIAVIGTGSLYKTASLSSGGGEAVASLLGGRPVSPDTKDVDERRLLNVVEEMSIAAGMPVPTVYLLDREPGINAFAAGLTRDDAVVGVTRGALDYLNRDELQGVMAHEASHILNGDMRLNLRLIGLLHGILLISLMGYFLVRGGGMRPVSRDRRGGAALLLFGLALLIIGWVGVFCGRLIKSAVSRQRELLADAAAVQFTRNPEGLAAALKKIGGLAAGSKLQTHRAEEASHLFFSKGAGGGAFGFMSTHPPLARRIQLLDPHWDGTFPTPEPRRPEPEPEARPAAARAEAGRRGPLPGLPIPGLDIPGLPETAATPPGWLVAVMAAVGNPSADHLAHASALLRSLPPEITDAAHQPSAARAVIAALLISDDDEVRRRQVARVQEVGDPALAEALSRVLPLASELPSAARLPLVDITLPALRRLSAEQYQAFRDLLGDLARADQRLSLFEYALHKVLVRHLDPTFSGRREERADIDSLRQEGPACSVLLSALAHAGHAGTGEAEAAFARAAADLGEGISEVELVPRSETTFARLDQALDRLVRVALPHRRRVLAAAAACVAWDGTVTAEEAELLRAIADALDCPVPPMLPSTGS